MEIVDFKGYTGICIHDITFIKDIMLVIVLILLVTFAWIFRSNYPLFGKMISNINAGAQRQSIFKTTEKDSFLFTSFMTFQTLLLIGIFIFPVTVRYKFISNPAVGTTFLYLSILFVLFSIFFLFKRVLYSLFGTIFIELSANKMMLTNYQSLFCLWGVSLYIPVFGVLLFDTHLFPSVILFIISYLMFKTLASLRIFSVFYNKNTGLLFLSLYLCAQEVVPLVFLYEGLVYTYNIIEKNNTWQ